MLSEQLLSNTKQLIVIILEIDFQEISQLIQNGLYLIIILRKGLAGLTTVTEDIKQRQGLAAVLKEIVLLRVLV